MSGFFAIFSRVLRWFLPQMVMIAGLVALGQPAAALKAISVSPDQDRVEITSLGELYDSRGDSLQIETAADSGVVAGRMTVRAATQGTNPSWIAFALHNGTDKPVERWLTAERYTMFGSGAVWPDLDARRIEALTPSIGFVPERIRSDKADIFRITIEPGQTITYVAELAGERFARVYLWKPIDYELKARDKQLFNGVLLGLTGLLAIFLTAVFAANHKAIFPSAALVAWCVLAHLTVDFGFFHKLFQLRPEDNAVYRAATESAMSASLVIFLNTFLRLSRAPSLIRMLLGLWVAGQLALVAVSVIDPRLAATFARVSFLGIGLIGALTTVMLALRGEDRALALVPTWLLFAVWVFGAAVIVTGRLATEIAASGLLAGLVLIVLLIGFTVTQFAFRSLEPAYAAGIGASQQQLSALAVEASGCGLIEWLVQRNEIKVSPVVDAILGLAPGTLSIKLDEFLRYVHEADRERLRLALSSVQNRPGAALSTQFRLRHADNSTRWFEVEAAGLPGSDPRSNRFVGLIRDITEVKRAHERLVHDAVYCSLTGIPNRAIFLDRLAHAMERARTDERLRPAIILIDLDRFRTINSQHGMPVGDSLLLTITRRLQRHVVRKELLARIGSDKFAILFEDEKQPHEFARDAEQIRRAVRAPIRINGQDIVVTGSLGIAIFDGTEEGQSDLLEAAEIAVARAKQGGADRIEIYRPEMRVDRGRRHDLAADLGRAIERNQLKVLYQPIIYLPTEELAGFEATVRFEHPQLGAVDPVGIDLPGDSDLVPRVWAYVLNRAAKDAARWQNELPRTERPLFVSFNVMSERLFKPELGRDVRRILDHGILPKGSLRLEVGESLVMDNPEQAGEILELLHGVGAELTLDGFGGGYCGLAYLNQLPFDTVKLDRSLVQSSGGGDASGAPVVRSLVAMSLELGKKVVADGVEDPEAVAFLRGIGCVYAQGFYYGDPMPDREVLQLLKLVRKAERSLEPRGLFRMSLRKSKKGGGDAASTGGASPSKPAAEGAAAPGRGRVKRRQGPGENGAPSRKTVQAPPAVPAQTSAVGPTEQHAPFGAPTTYPDTPHPGASYPGASYMAPMHSGGHFAAPYPSPPPGPYDAAHATHAASGGHVPPMSEPYPFNGSMPGDMPDNGSPPPGSDFAHPPPPPDPAHAAGANGGGYGSPTDTLAEDLAVVFGRAGQPTISTDPMSVLAATVGAAGPANGHRSEQPPRPAPPPPAPRALPEGTRVRTQRAAPDLSKLPPGLAASLAKLATNSAPAGPGGATLADGRPSTIPSLSAVQPGKLSDGQS